MDDQNTIFTREKLADAIHIWNRSAITLLDIRHHLISEEQALINYRLPASAFLYMRGEKAEVCLDSTFYNMERFGLFHSYKGCEVTITPQCNWLEYYLVLYKAGEAPFHKGEFIKLLARTNPFQQQYGFLPANPLFFAEQLRKMYEKWKGPTPLNLFYGKTAFYQLVYEIYEEMEQGRIHVLEPDLIAIAKRYLDKHYQDGIVIQELCDSLGISYSHFHRNFKQQTGKSPQEYLIKARLSAAMEALERGDSSVREVAIHCGFPDEINFYRQFVKHIGISPSAYKQTSQRHMRDGAMENRIPFPYNEQSQVSFDKLKGKGATFMLKQMRSKAIVAAALSLMLLMSACGTAPVNNGGNSMPSSVVNSQVSKTGGTKIVKTIRGDVEIPKTPQKVVVMNYAFGDILALGVTPAAVNDYWAIAGSAVEDLLKDIPRVSEPEEILSIEPDLIITAYEKDEDYEKLSKIAPTISFGNAKDTTKHTLEERLTFLSEVLGVESTKKDRVIAEYNEYVSGAKKALMDAGFGDKTFTFITNSMDNPGIVVSTYKGAYALYDVLGMQRSKKGQEIYESGEWYVDLSLEVLPEYCEDYLVIYGDGITNALSGNGVYENLNAVKNDRVILMNEYLSTFNDVISVKKQVEFFTQQLLESSNP